jgi:hypothetical protein
MSSGNLYHEGLVRTDVSEEQSGFFDFTQHCSYFDPDDHSGNTGRKLLESKVLDLHFESEEGNSTLSEALVNF